jgi:hypothetical protein
VIRKRNRNPCKIIFWAKKIRNMPKSRLGEPSSHDYMYFTIWFWGVAAKVGGGGGGGGGRGSVVDAWKVHVDCDLCNSAFFLNCTDCGCEPISKSRTKQSKLLPNYNRG